jgi:DNA primase
MTYLQDYKRKQKILKSVVSNCQHLLYSSIGEKAKEYLDSRLDYEEQLKWKFGYFPIDDNLHELTSIVSKEDLEFINFYYPKFLAGGTVPHGHFSEHNLILPFYDVHGDIVSVLGRCLITEDEREELQLQKYKYSLGTSKDLYVYGLNKAKKHIIQKNCVICVEGQFDCISLHAQGIYNVVALGWANMSRYQLFQLLRYTDNIILMFDNDEAGQKAKSRTKNRYKDVANIKLVSPPKEYKDIDEFFRNEKDPIYIQSVIDRIISFGDMNGKKDKPIE